MMIDKIFCELSPSMGFELVATAEELGCSKEVLLDAICLAFFWHNYDLLKMLYSKDNKNEM